MSSALCKLLGNQLVQNGQKVFLQELPPHSTLALYFTDDSAESKEFHGKLLEFRKEIKDSNRNFEVVLIPLEESCKTIISQWSGSSFITLDGEKARTIETFLIRKYVVVESRTVILIDGASGCVINFNGRQRILDDPKGIDFPFKHRPYSQILNCGPLMTINNHQKTNGSSIHAVTSSSLDSVPPPTNQTPCSFPTSSVPWNKDVRLNSLPPSTGGGGGEGGTSTPPTSMTIDKTPASLHQIKSDFKGFLFSAYWCPPCRSFVSTLVQVYHRLRRQGKNFQIIFVSSDRSEESFDRFFSGMPWLAIPWEDECRRQELTDYFNVKAIPSLIIVEDGEEGVEKIITAEGRLEINEDPEALEFPWYSKLVNELKDQHSNILNHSLSIIYLLGDDDEYDKAEGMLYPIASEISESDVEEALQPKFFIGTDSELTESLRLFIDLDESTAYILILDIPHKKFYTIAATQVRDDEDMREYIKRFQSAQLQFCYIEGHGYL